MNWNTSRTVDAGLWMMVVGSAGGLANALFGYFWSGNGIHGTPGALGVLCATAAMLIVTLLLALGLIAPRWLRGMFIMLLFPGIIGTAFCAYMLETNSLVALMAFALLGWFAHLLVGPKMPKVPASMTPGVT
jgi:quinoprotein glucose dehydrogenase